MDQNKYLDDYNATLAVVFGSLEKSKGKVSLVNVNKIIKQLGYDRLKRKDFDHAIKEIYQNDRLSDLAKQTINGEIGLDDLKKANGSLNSKLEDNLNDVLTPYQSMHQATLDRAREYNQIERVAARRKNSFDSIFNQIKSDVKSGNLKTDVPTIASHNQQQALVMYNCDWHTGNKFEITENKYNFEIEKQRVAKYTNNIISKGKELGITNLYYIHLGDIIEGINMRPINQAFSAEFDLAHQISNSLKLLTSQLEELSKHFNITAGFIAGNHDNLDGAKNNRIYGDSAMVIIMNQIKIYAETGVLKNIKVIDNSKDIYNLSIDVLGEHIYNTHGETLKPHGKDNIASHIQNKPIDLIVGGHYHNFTANQENNQALSIICPALKGCDTYSKFNNMGNAGAGQTSLVINENGNVDICMDWLK